LLAEAVDPLVQMAALHLHQAAGCRDGRALGQKHNGPSPFGQSRSNAWASQQSVEFFALLGGYGHDSRPLVFCHWNILVQETQIVVSLIFGS
jgi:hypothetical protein